MEDKNHPLSNKNEQSEKNSFFPVITKSEMHILIRNLKDALSNYEKNELQEIKKEESQIINNKSNALDNDIQSDEDSNGQLVNYQFTNSKVLNRFIDGSKNNTYSSIILPDLRKEYFTLINREGIRSQNFNDNKWIKESLIFSNFFKNEINIVFDFLKKFFWYMNNSILNNISERKSYVDLVLEYYSLIYNIFDLSNEKNKNFFNNIVKVIYINVLKKCKFHSTQLMNKNNENPLQTYKAPKRTDELYAKIFNRFSQYFIGEGKEDNNLLSLKNNNEFPLEEKESNERKFTLDNNRPNYIDSFNRDNNISSVGSLDSLFDEIEETKIEEHMPFITKMDNFVNEHYLNASE